jgi:hypothetical protein
MRIAVTGPREGQLDPMRQAYTMLAVKHFAKQLGIQRLKMSILVRLHEGVTLSFADSKDCEGLCEPVSKRYFIIDVATWGDWITTLAHEMVHVRQFAKGELNSTMSQWKSKKYCDNVEYWDQPWEKEARRLQHKLAVSFSKEQW